ncbi:KUP system potassium uptake protein [Anseongella ginsenosidimutans]|uniref:Probable potassium transport system protein Kup n=1 Tax=Anseongella ginsenosidimutans TaxID=496056 RepID=A0A4R3KZ60_9SPHI|nr:KUP/HAK/KT family potassium transporter [Anseongella ginsenosidimutans]TCS90346.1 KUP system potassium uptake protein [Anseongella ginsenosidimutans]
MKRETHQLSRLSVAGLLISLGIIYGDIGTSPLYVFKAIVGDKVISDDLVLGSLSCIFWTLTLQTTVKYVLVTLSADNKGEGGVFSLYSLIRRKAKWLVIPAMIGGATLLADGIITPPISVSSAIEGLLILNPDMPTVPIVILIITVLFFFQQFGTNLVGRAFGPLMIIWFSMLAIMGTGQLVTNFAVLKAINPYYAVKVLAGNPEALAILGAIFLCTTGAEALYSDMGHCGRKNIRVSWIFVKTCLLLNYFGQGAWLLDHSGGILPGNPFYKIMPEWFLIYGIGIATIATVIASQAMITGAFTLISEAVRLNLWPKVKINYPSDEKGQLYVPSTNWILYVGCVLVVLIFQKSSNMEHAYGLTIIMSMLITTMLMTVYLRSIKYPLYLVIPFCLVYLSIELLFFSANILKFVDGGWFTVVAGSILFSVMWCWYKARKIRNRYVRYTEIENYYQILAELSEDTSVSKYASNLVFLTSANFPSEIENKIIYSIIHKQPKRADIYWLVHVDVLDVPYSREYKVQTFIPNHLIRIDFRLGFREEQRVNLLFRKVVEEMVKNNEVNIVSRYESLRKHKVTGDFRFVILEKTFSSIWTLPLFERLVLYYFLLLKKLSLSEERGFGLDASFVDVEKVPLIIPTTEEIDLVRVE